MLAYYSPNPPPVPARTVSQGERLNSIVFFIAIFLSVICVGLIFAVALLSVALSNTTNDVNTTNNTQCVTPLTPPPPVPTPAAPAGPQTPQMCPQNPETCPTCPTPIQCTPCPTVASNRLVLTPEQVQGQMTNFEKLKDEILSNEGFYRIELLHKREYYTQSILPDFTEEQKEIILNDESSCADIESFRPETELQFIPNGQWTEDVPFQPSFVPTDKPGGWRKKRAASSRRSCGAYPPAPLRTVIVNGGLPASLVTSINGRIQWLFHEDCNGVKGSGCVGQCCEIIRYFKAWVFLVGDRVALEKDVEIHTCDCAN